MSEHGKLLGLAARAVPYLRDEAQKYDDDGSNDPLELAREIESLQDAGIRALPTLAIIDEIMAELDRAVAKFPSWPVDPLHAVAVLGEEFGELTQAVLQRTYDGASAQRVRDEAIQTAAMAIRFLQGLEHYRFDESDQVEVAP